ncbi:type II secretion system protein [Photobacterium leiognathi]|uniref:type II secretion system protein n=1 Tax=Photobacterium leiognathi TaxID=553611 RepID=UPI002981E95D|nr:prepilin-type N-terminal cleavage/methylation domain-containing protein [Photobacterium leiognathi]
MKKNGFTLIELVVVIVILGILAVVAAPKFMNLQVDARNASLKGLEGSLKSALGTTYAKLTIAGLENERYVTTRKNSGTEQGVFSADLNIPGCPVGTDCVFNYGYPINHITTLKNLIENFNTDWQIAEYKGGNRITFKQFTKGAVNGGNQMTRNDCYLTYAPPTEAGSGYTLTFHPCK